MVEHEGMRNLLCHYFGSQRDGFPIVRQLIIHFHGKGIKLTLLRFSLPNVSISDFNFFGKEKTYVPMKILLGLVLVKFFS
jgi:hypothetical protein